MVPGSQWPQMLPHCIRLRWQSSTSDTADIRRAALWKFYGRLNCTASLLRITCTMLAEASGLQIGHFLWSFISDMFSRPRWRTPTYPALPADRRQAFRDAGTGSACAAQPTATRLVHTSVSDDDLYPQTMTTWLQCGAELQAAAEGGGREAEAAGGNLLWFLTFSYTVCCVLLI